AIKGRDASLKSIKSKKTNIISEKKSIKAKYVVEIILLTNANKVAAEILKPVYPKPLVHDSEETTALSEVSRATMSKKPGHVQPINYDKLNALYSQFFPQKELSREQVYWQSPADVSTPTTSVKLFVKTRPAPSQ
nr:hypothetical protein [Tanacetum cinerariifolium]